MSTYRCTNPACGWQSIERIAWRMAYAAYRGHVALCPKCGFHIEDLDLLERKAIREDAGFSEEDAERLAKEDMEKWREE